MYGGKASTTRQHTPYIGKLQLLNRLVTKATFIHGCWRKYFLAKPNYNLYWPLECPLSTFIIWSLPWPTYKLCYPPLTNIFEEEKKPIILSVYINCTLYTLYYTLYNLHCTIYTVHCKLYRFV